MAQPFIAYCGQHECASGWLNRITAELAAAAGLRYEEFNRPEMFGSDLGTHIEANNLECISWTNTHYRMIQDLDFRAFHVVRDPRDLFVSAYFSHRNSHPTDDWPKLVPFREKLLAVSKEEGLILELDFLSRVFDRFRAMDLNDPRILQLTLERISPNDLAELERAYEFIGLFDRGLKPRHCRRVMKANSFEKRSRGRKKGVEDQQSHYRKGVAGDWQNHFTEEIRTVFKERCNDILIQYGYEADENW